jgi:hypothetical protein
MARDKYHEIVRQVLINDGWEITHDPYRFEKWDPEWEIDLGAEKMIGATKANTKIAVEVKTFLQSSFANEFHSVLGQYLNYAVNLKEYEAGRILYLAVPSDVWKTQFQRKGIQVSVKNLAVKIIVYDMKTKAIEKWIQ